MRLEVFHKLLAENPDLRLIADYLGPKTRNLWTTFELHAFVSLVVEFIVFRQFDSLNLNLRAPKIDDTVQQDITEIVQYGVLVSNNSSFPYWIVSTSATIQDEIDRQRILAVKTEALHFIAILKKTSHWLWRGSANQKLVNQRLEIYRTDTRFDLAADRDTTTSP